MYIKWAGLKKRPAHFALLCVICCIIIHVAIRHFVINTQVSSNGIEESRDKIRLSVNSKIYSDGSDDGSEWV